MGIDDSFQQFHMKGLFHGYAINTGVELVADEE